MKKHSFINTVAMLFLGSVTVLSLLTSCEGPAGVAGVDANETCTQCHNSESVLVSKIQQASHSRHYTGITSFENRTTCAACHTSQGFIERIARDTTGTLAEIQDPASINCRTCHMIHTNYDTTDFQLRGSEPVTLWVGGVTKDFGTSNTCVNCHQSRPINPLPVLGGDSVSVTSSRWGPHYGPQSGTLSGVLGYRIAGATAYPSGDHPHMSATDGCITCHMAEAVGKLTGGHSLNMYNEEEGENLTACEECHSTIEDFDYNGVQTEVANMMTQLEEVLTTNGLLTSSGSVNASSSKPLKLNADAAGTLLNYRIIKYDFSNGVHNPALIKALLKNSLQYWGI